MRLSDAHNEPCRTLLWDEASARYIWLDDGARAVAARIRAKRVEFQASQPGHYVSALADLYISSDFDATTRNVARSCKNSAKRKSAGRADKARAAAKPIAAKPRRAKLKPIFLDEIVGDLVAALAGL